MHGSANLNGSMLDITSTLTPTRPSSSNLRRVNSRSPTLGGTLRRIGIRRQHSQHYRHITHMSLWSIRRIIDLINCPGDTFRLTPPVNNVSAFTESDFAFMITMRADRANDEQQAVFLAYNCTAPTVREYRRRCDHLSHLRKSANFSIHCVRT